MLQGFIERAAVDGQSYSVPVERYDLRAIRAMHEKGNVEPPEGFYFGPDHLKGAVIAQRCGTQRDRGEDFFGGQRFGAAEHFEDSGVVPGGLQQSTQRQPGAIRADHLGHDFAVLANPPVHLRESACEGAGAGCLRNTPLLRGAGVSFFGAICVFRGRVLWAGFAVDACHSIVTEGICDGYLVEGVRPLFAVQEAYVTEP